MTLLGALRTELRRLGWENGAFEVEEMRVKRQGPLILIANPHDGYRQSVFVADKVTSMSELSELRDGNWQINLVGGGSHIVRNEVARVLIEELAKEGE